MKTAIGYKLLERRGDGRIVSQYDGSKGGPRHKPWIIGKWETIEGPILLCGNGFHCWESIDQEKFVKWAMPKRNSVVALVEFDSENCLRQTGGEPKVVSKSMRILMVKPYVEVGYSNDAIRESLMQFYK